jgi:hypothetical protein
VAIDQTPSTSSPGPTEVSAIENEFPAYRAISSTAVLSLLFGLASVFCYADLWFLTFVVAAVILGLVSLRKIRQLPEILTGTAFARLGIGIALLFGLTAVTRVVSQDFLGNLDAGWFAKRYVEVIKDKPINEALWWQQQPAYRKTKHPDEIVEDLKKAKGPAGLDPYQEKVGVIQRMKDRLKGKGEEIHFSKIESKAIDGLTTYANALIELDGPGSTEFPEKEQFALLLMVKGGDGEDWVVKEVKFPYTPASVAATVEKKDDDGHGQAGGH